LEKIVYLDNAAAVKPCKAATAEFMRVCENMYANPSSVHGFGISCEHEIEKAREKVLSFLPSGGDLVFTSGATESNNIAVTGAVAAYAKSNAGGTVLTTGVEHKSVSEPFNALSGNFEKLVVSPKDVKGVQGDFTEYIISKIRPDTFFISVICKNNETGEVTDTARLYKAVKRINPACIMHTDAAAGFMKLNKGEINGDLITVSALKTGGICGIGGLYIKRGVRVKPLIIGGGHQKGLRGGSECTALAAAFAAACENYVPVNENLHVLLAQRLKPLNNVKINFSDPYIVSLCFAGVKSETLTRYLSDKRIYVSAGSACNKGKVSDVLLNSGLSQKEADCTIRVSFCGDNDERDVNILADAIFEAGKRFSTF
jgi:cysteine desulfurase